MQKRDAAAFLAGVSQTEGSQASAPTNLHVISGEVGTRSEDGKTTVAIDGLVFSEADDQYVEMDTLGGLEEGDVATIILTGEDGHAMTPLAIGAPGSVDRLSERIIETELLLADKASIGDLEAATARIGDLEADHVSVSDFEAEQANIDSLQAATADIDTIRANSAKVQNLTAAQLEADHVTIGTLDTNYAKVNLANVDNAWIENGTVKDGAITNAMINSVSANKLTAGTIDASNITVTNLNADNITTGTINGQRIGEGSLSLDKLSESVYTEAEVNNIVDGLNDRIDGAIETFTGTTVPTLNNQPASSWNTTKLKDEHVGDVYYVVNSQSQQNGYCYRFTKSGSTYSWQLIKDSDVTAALSRLTTAEGKITSIESFDSTVSSFMTNTNDELTSVKSRATSLETRMTDAEGDISDKVDTSTFNTLSQTVDTNTASITSLSSTVSQKADGSTVTALTNRVSTVEQDVDGIETSIGELQDTLETKADGSTVSTISNRLNTVSDTVDGHTQTLTSVQNTLDEKADSSTVSTLTTKVNTIEDTVDGHTQTISGQSTVLSNNGLTSSTNITNRVSSVEQDLSGYKTTVSETYATQTALATTNGNVTAAQTAADNAQAAADRANGRQVAYSATSSTGATTAAKVAACTNFPALAAGATVTVRFSAANTSTGAVTLNVNSTGAKTVYVNGSATSSSNQLLWGANANITFTYDGSYWRVDSEPRTWYGTGSVAAATAAKTATINEVVICKGTTVVLNMTNENTSTSATLNVTSTGAKNIYYGTTTTRPTTANGYGWGAGSTVSLTFDGQYWRIGDTTALARLTAAESTISSHTTSIEQNASAIALKADSSTTYTKTDVDGLISTEVTNRNAAITAKANEITSSVSETYATKSSVNGKADASDVTALAGRVTTAESNITQNANNIALKVSESDVTGNYLVGKINLDSTTASIAAEHINLQGAVTISDLASDASTALTNAAKTATSYVTEITGQNGIMVHPSTDDDTGVRITSDVDIMRDGYSILNIGTKGDTTSTDAGVTIYDGDGNESADIVATFTRDLIELGRNSRNTNIKMCDDSYNISTSLDENGRVVSQLWTDKDHEYVDEYARGRTWVEGVTDPLWANLVLRSHCGWREEGRDYEYPEHWVYEHSAKIDVLSTDDYSQIIAQSETIDMKADRVVFDDPYTKYGMAPNSLQLGAPTRYQNSGSYSIKTAGIDTYTNGPRITIPAGSYMFVGVWTFNSASSSGDRNMQVGFRSGASGTLWGERVRIRQSSGNFAVLNVSALRVFTSETTVYLAGSASITSGAGDAWITAVRLN